MSGSSHTNEVGTGNFAEPLLTILLKTRVVSYLAFDASGF